MNKLILTLGKDKKEKAQQSTSNNFSMMKSMKGKPNNSIWLLDIQSDPCLTDYPDVNQNFLSTVLSLIQKKFHDQKYLQQIQQSFFQQIIAQLSETLHDLPTPLSRMVRIQTAITEISMMEIGQVKNCLKNFHSLLDVRIRKLKRKQKKNELSEFDRIVNEKIIVNKKHQNMYIDEDRDQKKHIHRKESRIKNHTKNVQHETKKSYGTMNSGSNQNQSGSGRKSGGSQSRSSQGNALAVLLTNRDPKRKQDNEHQKNEKTVNQSYDFSAVMSSSVAVRQRNDKKPRVMPQDSNQTINHLRQNKIKKKQSASDQKDQAFIFHRPKKGKRPFP